MHKTLTTPITSEQIRQLHMGDIVLLSGKIFTARDAAHQRMADYLNHQQPLPFDVRGQAVFYAGPCPAPPGKIIGAVGPTTAGRMDRFAPQLIREGLAVMIGKGARSPQVIAAIRQYTGLYLAAVGGAAALLARCVLASEPVAFEDLGTEAIRMLTVRDMPLVVAIDCTGKDLYARTL